MERAGGTVRSAGTGVPDFDAVLCRHGVQSLRRASVRTLQVNVGKLCNQTCHHCHVDASPRRTEVMARETAERVVALLAASPSVNELDLTGGAPELNPSFTFLVRHARRLERPVRVRCNLTVLLLGGMEKVPDFYRRHGVELICSLPCYTMERVDQQRGQGVFARSIEALRWLNRLGYGLPDSSLRLNLVYNPLGPSLPPPQAALEARYREELRCLYGIEFHRLFTITNMPIKRFADQLHSWGQYEEYLALLVNHFNPAVVPDLMCRTLVSVGWDGALYDCDFNQMLELPIAEPGTQRRRTVWDVANLDRLDGEHIATAAHCFGCTAGTGSSCGGALE